MFISPMLLQNAKNNEPFNSKNHITELMLDGYRLIVSNMDKLNLYTRHSYQVNYKFPELYDCPIPEGTILDGELIITDQDGKSDFEAMRRRFQSRRDKTPVTFYAFDIIRYKGIDVTGLPLLTRKELLDESFQETDRYKKVKVVEGEAPAYFDIVKKHGLEGMVIKDAWSKYEIDKRSWSWQKVINWTYAEVYIIGYRKKDFGLLTSIEAEDGSLHATGIIEFKVNAEQKKELKSVTRRLVYKEDNSFVHMKPMIKAGVKTRNWTKNGMLRSPEFVKFVK
jgi:DNA ligase-1